MGFLDNMGFARSVPGARAPAPLTGWRADFAYLNDAIRSGRVGSAPQYQAPRAHYGAGQGFDPWAISKPGESLWGSLGSGKITTPKVKAPARDPVLASMEKIDVRLGVSGEPQESALMRATKGDFLGSVGEALGNVGAELNLANAIPYLMERTNALAGELADSEAGTPVGALAGGVEAGTDFFLDGVQAVSDVVAPILNAPHDFWRDSVLGDKAKVYRAIVTGRPISSEFNPIEAFGMTGNLIPGETRGARDIAGEYEMYRQLLEQSLDPHTRDKAQTSLNILRDALDLPESVKYAIEANPDGDLEKYLDEAPEGRQWSYDPGLAGNISRLGHPLIIYISEYIALRGMGRAAVRGSVGPQRAGLALREPYRVGVDSLAGKLGQAGHGTLSQAVVTGTRAAARATTIAARLQTAAMATGLPVAVLTTGFDAVARFQGDEAAIAWADRVLRTTEFSDDPQVQLVTGFAVNPFAAGKMAVQGTVRLAHGVGDVTIGKALGTRFVRYYTHETLMYDQIRRMYKLGSVDEARDLVNKTYDSPGQAFDVVMGNALDKVLDSLPREERMAFNALHPDPVARSAATLQTYGTQAMDLLEKHPDEVAARWYTHNWEYLEMPGPFSREVASLVSKQYVGLAGQTFKARARLDAVVGTVDLLPPPGQALARAWLDRVAGEGDTVKVAGVDGVQDLIRQFRALRKHWPGLVPGGAKTVPRSAVEEMIRRAEVEYNVVSRRSPVKASTGADPVIRPDSPTLLRDYGEGLGTTPATVKALEDFNLSKPDPAHVDLLRAFIVDKLQMAPESAAAMPPVQVWEAAADYFAEVTRPWIEAGERIVKAEGRQVEVRNELARLNRIGVKRGAHTEAIGELEAEMSNLLRITREAGDPIVPFSREVRFRGVVEKRINRIRAMDPAKLSKADDDLLRTFLLEDLNLSSSGLRGAALHERALDGIPTVTEGRVATARDAHLAEMAQRKVEAMEVLRTLDAIDDQAEALMPRKVADVPWHQLLRRTPEGNLGWSGGMAPVSEAMRRRMADYLRNQGGIGRATAQDMLYKGDAEVWEVLSRYPGAMEGFTVAQRRYVLAARGNAPDVTGIDEWADAWQKSAGAGGTSEAFLEELTRLHGARADALAGRMEHNIRRTGALKVPPVYLTEAEIAQSGRDLWVDAEFETTIHPMNVARVRDILASPEELYGRLREEVYGDGRLLNHVESIAQDTGIPVTELLRDPIHASKLKPLIPEDFDPPVPGVAVPETEVDALIVARDPALARLAEVELKPAAPVTMLHSRASEIATKAVRPSVKYRRDLNDAGADLSAAPDGAILDDPGNALGLDVLSVLNRGITGTRPATIRGTIELLREIENGNATSRGIGLSLQAEGQRVAMEILKAARNAAKREGIEAGVLTRGVDAAMMEADDLELMRLLSAGVDPSTGRPGGGAILTYDPTDPIATLQYGLKKRPADAVVMEWSQVPGLAEEFMAGRFQPWQERVWTAQTRQAYNWLFGRHSNAEIRARTRELFIERAGRQGVDATVADAIWTRWRDIAQKSRRREIQKVKSMVPGGKPTLRPTPGDSALYGDVRNIPTNELHAHAFDAIDDLFRGTADAVSPYRAQLETINYGSLFREASSTTRRSLADAPIPLGDKLASMYGLVAHNYWVTTAYTLFRFGLDIRYHAMNYFEHQLLALGRAGLRRSEVDTGLFGYTRDFVRHLDENPADNVGYPLSRSRAESAYKVLRKEQPDANRAALRGIAAEDPQLMAGALEELAKNDPELSGTILLMGDDSARYLEKMDAWYRKMLRGVDELDDAKTIDEAIAKEAASDPAMAEVYGRLAQVNKDLWADIRGTFYGNAERSRVERLLNSYLLYWPISYQLKAAKWMIQVLYNRAGGLQTNAAGAVVLDRALSAHQRLLATDAEYQDWYEKHRTLLFVASMLLPITPTSMGVSLSPPLRALFFGKAKAFWDVGPFLTARLAAEAGEELYADLYPSLRDVPGFNEVYRMTTGRQPPKAPPIDELAEIR